MRRYAPARQLVACAGLVWVLASLVVTGQGPAYVWDLPPGFPQPRVPPDNPMTSEKVELGRHLFYDTRLSLDGTFACANCHHVAWIGFLVAL